MTTRIDSSETDIVQEIIIEVAMDLALGVHGHGSVAVTAIQGELGREMTAGEMAQFLDDCAEARRQVDSTRAMRSRHVFGLDSLALVRGAL